MTDNQNISIDKPCITDGMVFKTQNSCKVNFNSLIKTNHCNAVEGSSYTCTAVCTALYSYLAPAWPQ